MKFSGAIVVCGKAPYVMASMTTMVALSVTLLCRSCLAQSIPADEVAIVAKAEKLKHGQKALALLEKYMETHPKAVLAIFNAARMANLALLNDKTVLYSTRYLALKEPPINPYIYHLRAHAYCCLHEQKKALADLAVARKANPNDAEVYILLGDAQSGLGHYKEACEAFAHAAKLNETSGWRRKADVEFGHSDWHRAAVDYAEYINKTGDHGAPLNKVQSLIQKGEHEKALALIDEMLRANIPKAEETLMVLRADVLYALNRKQECLQACEAFEKKFKTGQLNPLKYQIVFAAKDYEKSLLCLDGMIKSNPRDRSLLVLRGDCYRALDEYVKALADYNRVPDLVIKSEQARLGRAECNYQLGHVQEALTEIEAINSVDPSAENYGRQARYLRALKRYKDAVICLNRAIKLKPLSANYFCERGDCLRQLKDYPRALKDFSDAITLHPENLLFIYGRGLLYSEMGRSRDAIKDFTAVLANPNLTSRAYLERAKAYEQLGDKVSAENDRTAAKRATKSVEEDFYR